jgi:succinate-semialdehyde dehydrogenase / glutarate-semialdehyde dehydrogenase
MNKLATAIHRRLLFTSSLRAFNTPASTGRLKGIKLDNPYTGKIIEEVPYLTKEEQQKVLKRCWESYRAYRYTSIEERKRVIQNVVGYFRQHREEIATDITQQMGKPITQSREEVDYSVERMEVLINIADQALAPEIVQQTAKITKKVIREPVSEEVYLMTCRLAQC